MWVVGGWVLGGGGGFSMCVHCRVWIAHVWQQVRAVHFGRRPCNGFRIRLVCPKPAPASDEGEVPWIDRASSSSSVQRSDAWVSLGQFRRGQGGGKVLGTEVRAHGARAASHHPASCGGCMICTFAADAMRDACVGTRVDLQLAAGVNQLTYLSTRLPCCSP